MSRTQYGSRQLIGGAAALALTIVVGATGAQGQVAPKAPEPATLAANAELAKTLPFDNREDFEDAMRLGLGRPPAARGPRERSTRMSTAAIMQTPRT